MWPSKALLFLVAVLIANQEIALGFLFVRPPPPRVIRPPPQPPPRPPPRQPTNRGGRNNRPSTSSINLSFHGQSDRIGSGERWSRQGHQQQDRRGVGQTRPRAPASVPPQHHWRPKWETSTRGLPAAAATETATPSGTQRKRTHLDRRRHRGPVLPVRPSSVDHRQARDGEALEGNEEDATLEPPLEETGEGGGTDNTNLVNTVGRGEDENEGDLFEPLLQGQNEGGDEAEAKIENTVEAESAARNSEKAGAKEKETDAEKVDGIAKKSSERIDINFDVGEFVLLIALAVLLFLAVAAVVYCCCICLQSGGENAHSLHQGCSRICSSNHAGC